MSTSIAWRGHGLLIRRVSWVLAIVLALGAGLVGAAGGWVLGTQFWESQEVRLARNFEQALKRYGECQTSAKRLFRPRQPLAGSAKTLRDQLVEDTDPNRKATGQVPSELEALWNEAGREVFVSQRCQREEEEVHTMELAIKLVLDRQR